MKKVTQALLAARRLKRAYAKEFEGLCAREGLTAPQVDILLFLGNNPGHDTARDIVELRGLAKSYVSKSIEELIEKNLLEGLRKEADRRQIHLRLTKAAGPLLRDAQRIQRDFFERMYQGFSKEEKTQMEAFLQRMTENVAPKNEI
ncbi:MAG: MarR family transcriptional regulator [Oscillospiraceae bacterium]|nr:MarR family transcriptional regulator [Oscillospiraceae bacterium]